MNKIEKIGLLLFLEAALGTIVGMIRYHEISDSAFWALGILYAAGGYLFVYGEDSNVFRKKSSEDVQSRPE
jgi:hypothetical protein